MRETLYFTSVSPCVCVRRSREYVPGIRKVTLKTLDEIQCTHDGGAYISRERPRRRRVHLLLSPGYQLVTVSSVRDRRFVSTSIVRNSHG